MLRKKSLRHARETNNYEDYMALRFAAKSVNVVLTPEQGETFKVQVKLDGEYLNEFNKGEDVVIEDDGKSYIIVDKPRLYAVVEAPEYGTYELELSSNSSDFALCTPSPSECIRRASRGARKPLLLDGELCTTHRMSLQTSIPLMREH